MKTLKTTMAIMLGVLLITACDGTSKKAANKTCAKECTGKQYCEGCKEEHECQECTAENDCKECSANVKGDQCKTKHSKDMKFTEKYTNADFYKNGELQQDVARKAYYQMFEHYGYPVTALLDKEVWFTDFTLGDFENCGMGGIFWVNDKEHGYFAHDIFLLPGQMIPEHSHVKTTMPAKFESWMVRDGWCYNFTEIGDPTANGPAIPASQAATTKSKHFVRQNVGEVIHLAKEGSWHFLMAGDEGAIVHEWANYHDGAGLRFTNPKAKL